jgi:hypothetical protein
MITMISRLLIITTSIKARTTSMMMVSFSAVIGSKPITRPSGPSKAVAW